MQIRGLSLDDFELITRGVSATLYNGNLTVHDDSMAYDGDRCRARIRAGDSHGLGARISWSGRHGPWACWHAYRDVLAAVFERYPHAVIRTGMATYHGRAGFARNYPATGERNIGSQARPTTMPELCDCTHGPAVDMTGWAEQPPPGHSHRTLRGAARCPDCNPEHDAEDPLVRIAEPTYAETMTRINDVLDGMTDWEREITAEQYRKDSLS